MQAAVSEASMAAAVSESSSGFGVQRANLSSLAQLLRSYLFMLTAGVLFNAERLSLGDLLRLLCLPHS